MTHWLYLIGLLASIGGIALLDRRFRLAYWYDRRRTLITVAFGLVTFVVWDLLAIRLGIFIHGDSNFALPFTLLPEFPPEEPLFLVLLCYSTLVIYNAGGRKWQRI